MNGAKVDLHPNIKCTTRMCGPGRIREGGSGNVNLRRCMSFTQLGPLETDKKDTLNGKDSLALKGERRSV